MPERETSQDIDRIATEWVARMDRAPLSESEADELKQWLAGDRRRRGAFIRAKAVWMRSESASALGPHYDPENFQLIATHTPAARVEPRSRWMKWSGAVAASLVVAVILMTGLPIPTAYATAKGEIRTVPLGNGTTVTLNTDTHIRVYDDDGQRRIRVLQGEVLVESTGAAKPTLIDVGEKHLEAATATFVIRQLQDQPTEILVQEGRVLLTETSQSETIPLSANTGASLLEGRETSWQLSALSSGQMGRELAWREGKIALQGETLAEAAAVYARYSDTPIVVVDPELAQTPVTGLFAINNPLGFSYAVADVFGARVRQEDGRIVISRL